MGVKPGQRAFLRGAPASLKAALRPGGARFARRLSGKFDFVVDFVTDAAALPQTFRLLKAHVEPTGQLWVAWPKGKQDDSGPRLAEVIRVGYNHGLVESQCISLDEHWSALKFTFPKRGKVYCNSYGKLPAK